MSACLHVCYMCVCVRARLCACVHVCTRVCMCAGVHVTNVGVLKKKSGMILEEAYGCTWIDT